MYTLRWAETRPVDGALLQVAAPTGDIVHLSYARVFLRFPTDPWLRPVVVLPQVMIYLLIGTVLSQDCGFVSGCHRQGRRTDGWVWSGRLAVLLCRSPYLVVRAEVSEKHACLW